MRLEAETHSHDRSVENLIETGGVDSAARAVVHAERAKAEHRGDLVAGELPGIGVGADRLPRERAGEVEAADVATHEDLLIGRELWRSRKPRSGSTHCSTPEWARAMLAVRSKCRCEKSALIRAS